MKLNYFFDEIVVGIGKGVLKNLLFGCIFQRKIGVKN